MSLAIHHLHKRKRVSKKQEPYPANSKWKRFLDKLVYVVGVLGPILTIPQIIKIWIYETAAGISLISWISYFAGAIVLFIYGLSHKEKLLIVMYGCWIIVDIILIISILLFN